MAPESSRERYARLLAILAYLAHSGGATITELSERFDVSRARVRKDLDTLWVSGLPGESPEDLIDFDLNDDETAVSLREGLGLERPLRLTPREVISLTLALEALAGEVTDPALAQELSDLRRTVADLLPVASTGGGEPVAHLDDLREAIRARRSLTMTYVSAEDRRSVRTIDPIGLEARPAGWFLLAFCHTSEALRTFTVERIEALAPSAEPWRAPQSAVRARRDSGPGIEVELRCDASVRWLAERLGARTIQEAPDASIRFRVTFFSTERLVRTVLAVADRVHEIAPADAAELVADRAGEALRRLAEVRASAGGGGALG
ncbi:MAG: WYL domain-containing protein [Bowdeniella nasicola]|nr:WYL domain-containing protein [Bowdeniella nasicola]